MEDFSFLVCLIVWHDVLFEVNLISKTLQGKSTDIALTSNLLQKTLQFIDDFRKDSLNDSVSKAKEICSEIDVEPLFKEKHQRTKNKLFDYESKSDYKATPEEEFKRNVFYPLLDIMQASLKERLIQFSNHNLKWGFLYDLKQLPHAEDLKECCENLQKHLSFGQTSDISGKELYQELLHVKTIVNEVSLAKATPLQVLKVIKKTDRKDTQTYGLHFESF
ncbi:hypothetical protein J6590_108579 [Homalodisca vitripennis]|nr:hypothetical protein J6590_108579 [Homalodisca vitripennis]